MIISSTEFQQRVGYYLSLVEKGIDLLVRRSKPGRRLFLVRLAPKSPQEEEKKMTKAEKVLKKIAEVNLQYDEHDGVAYQRRVRQ
jgi:hypothetical protein